jgi:tetratricopeptide (TPR) repeat protein
VLAFGAGTSGAVKYRLMLRTLTLFVFCVSLGAAAQQHTQPTLPPSQPPPRSDQTQDQRQDAPVARNTSGNSSSSKDDSVDLRPPQDDQMTHPDSSGALREAEDQAGLYEGDELGGIQEFKPWNPHKAEKDIEVGDYYFKRKNYRAALDRYREALYYKDNDAVATFKLAVCQEKVGESDEARKAYAAYLKILPAGPFAEEARRALERLQPQSAVDGPAANKTPAPQ